MLARVCSAAAQDFETQVLTDFQLASAADQSAGGAEISQTQYGASHWQAIQVPNTVVGALVDANQFVDPYVDMKLRALPGMDYPVDQQFDGPMPETSPYRHAFWYRRPFTLPKRPGVAWYLQLDGVNYRANIWLNGSLVAGADQVVGAFRRHEIDLTRYLADDGRNVLAIEVFAPGPHDLAFAWVDWNPSPPDKNMGLWGRVALVPSGALRIRHPYVTSRFADSSLARASLSVSAEIENTTANSVEGRVHGRIGAIAFESPVHLAGHERRVVQFTPKSTPALVIDSPRVWWPYRMGGQHLYELVLSASVAGRRTAQTRTRFGIHEMTSELTSSGHRQFKVNGKPLLVRGAAWASDMFLRPKTRERLNAELRYVREMGLNTIRQEGQFESDLLYELTDELGILVMPGLCCCSQWEEWPTWDEEDRRVAVLSVRDLLLRLRNHPSVLAWSNASDRVPPPDIERAYLDIAHELGWTKPLLSSASEAESQVTGPTGVKMLGPYDYVPPAYWYVDSSRGGAFGFATEVGPGAAIMVVESLKQTFSARHLWPLSAAWTYHAGIAPFSSLHEHIAAIEARYGKTRSLETFVRYSQTLSYETTRAMFEAYGRNRYEATGVIHWMLNNAWPSLTWHLYDYYLRPSGGYYGAKKACEPLHVQFSYDDRSVVVVNDTQQAAAGMRVTASLFDFALKQRFHGEQSTDVPADGVVRVMTVPRPKSLSTTHFLRLALYDDKGVRRSENLYWLSTKEDELDWSKAHSHHTPTKVHADLRQLQRLPKTTVVVTAETRDTQSRLVTVKNTGSMLAFQVTLQLVDADGVDVLPSYWEDNQIALFPGEERRLWVEFAGRPALPLRVRASAWNAASAESPL
jgi:exo-1,4-beta-D-glucosaminidase